MGQISPSMELRLCADALRSFGKRTAHKNAGRDMGWSMGMWVPLDPRQKSRLHPPLTPQPSSAPSSQVSGGLTAA